MSKHKITMSLIVDKDPDLLSDDYIADLHLAMLVQCEDIFGVSESILKFDNKEVSSLGDKK